METDNGTIGHTRQNRSLSGGEDSFQHSRHLRSDFVASDDEGHFAAPGVDEAGPAGVQGDVVAILAAEAHGRVLKRRLSSILQDWGRGGSLEFNR